VSTQPFAPQGNTVAITVTGSSSTAVQVPSGQGAGLGSGNYMLTVVGTTNIFFVATPPVIGSAITTAATAAAAVIPTGSPANGVPLLGGSAQTITLAPGSWITTIAGATGSTLYITPGDGA